MPTGTAAAAEAGQLSSAPPRRPSGSPCPQPATWRGGVETESGDLPFSSSLLALPFLKFRHHDVRSLLDAAPSFCAFKGAGCGSPFFARDVGTAELAIVVIGRGSRFGREEDGRRSVRCGSARREGRDRVGEDAGN
jgi:hypothetical protein